MSTGPTTNRRERPADSSPTACRHNLHRPSSSPVAPDIEMNDSAPGPRNITLRACDGAFVDASGAAYDNEKYRQFFRRYPIAEVMRGCELAQDMDLFNIVRRYRDVDIRTLLKFVEDDALPYLEELKDLRGSDILELSEATLGTSQRAMNYQEPILKVSHTSHPHRFSNSSRDSGYASRPTSEVECSSASIVDEHFHKSPANQLAPVNDISPIEYSHSSEFPSPHHLTVIRGQPRSTASVPNSPHTLNESSVSSPSATIGPSRSRLYECMYCTQDFVRYGDCLNHEENYHSQRKEWTCLHCGVQWKTKAGYDRHHKGHNCQKCKEPERVAILSGPKTACACPYCGALFEGTGCFAIRANHIKAGHYKGEQRKTRADMNHSVVIESLLCRQGFSGPWKVFLETKRNVRLSWTPEKARQILDDLEFGDYPKGIHSSIQRVYGLADKREIPANESHNPMDQLGQHSERETPTIAPVMPSGIFARPTIPRTEAVGLGVDSMNSSLKHKHIPTRYLDSPAMTTAQRTSQVLASSSTGEKRPRYSPPKHVHLEHNVRSSEGPVQELSADLRENVFMGWEIATPGSPELMDLVQNARGTTSTPTPRNPTSACQSWAFGDLDDPLLRMEDIMTQQLLAYPQSSTNATSYSPLAWEDRLPPSLRTAAANASPPPNGPLPVLPRRHTPDNTTLRY